jgi:hypothetical protein
MEGKEGEQKRKKEMHREEE